MLNKKYEDLRKIIFDDTAIGIIKQHITNYKDFMDNYTLSNLDLNKKTKIYLKNIRAIKHDLKTHFKSNLPSGWVDIGYGSMLNPDGDLMRVDTRKPITKYISESGYVCAYLDNRIVIYVHKELGKHFIDNPKGHPLINHKDGNKSNYKLSNLEWESVSGNARHAVDTGLSKVYGEDNGNSKLKDFEVRAIMSMRGRKAKDIASDYKVSPSTIRDIWSGKRKHKGT